MADIDVKELASNLLTELKNIATGGNSSGQNHGEGKGDSASIDLSKFNQAVDKLAEKLGAFATQIGINVDALKAIPGTRIGYESTNDTSKAFADAVKLLDKDMALYVNKLEQIRLQAAAGNNVGIGQGDAKTQEAQFQAAGYKNFGDGLKGVTDAAGNFKSSLAGLGNSADESTRRYNQFSEQLAKTPEIKELIKKNLIQPTDVPKLAMIAAQGKTNALDTPESRAKLVSEMAREAQMISQISNAYGISKQAIMDNAIANNENTDAQIRQQALGDDAARRALRTAQAISTPSGKSISDLVDKLSTGARLSKEDRAMLSVGTMGMGGQLTSAVKDVQRTKNLAFDDPQRIAAEKKLADVEAEIRRRQASPEAARLAQSMKDGTNKEVLTRAISESRAAAAPEKKIREETGVGVADSAKIAQQNIGAAQIRGERQQPSGANPPVANTGAKVSETLSEINFAYIKNAAAVSAILGELNVKLGDTASAFKAVKDILTDKTFGPGPANESVEEKKNRLRPLANVIEGAITPPSVTSQDLNRRSGLNADGSIAGPVSVTTPNVNVTSPNVTVTPTSPSNNAPGPTPTTPTMRRRPDGTAEPIPTETRGTGTLGETGFPTEMKDVVAKLHKGETVVTPDQMKNLLSGAAMMSASDIVTSLLAGMSGNKGANGIDMNKSLGTVTTNVSSADTPPLSSDTVYTGTLKALKELGITTLPPSVAPTPTVKKENTSTQMESYTIKAGDNLTKIAEKAGISIQDIMKANPSIKDKDKIYTGAKLELPTIKVPTSTAPSTNSTNNVQDPAQKQQAAAFDYATLKAQYDKMSTSPAATVESLAALKTQMDAAIKNQPAPVAPAVPPVTVTTPKPGKSFDNLPVTVTTPEIKVPAVPPVTVTTPEPKAPVIQPVTVAVPKPVTPVTKTNKTDSIIDKQLAKFGVDIGNLSGKLPNAVSTPNIKNQVTQTTQSTVNPEAGIKKIFDSVSTTISSVTGGGSTTRKSVQNEDSKAAQAQLDALMSQYTRDRAAIGSKISESLGPDAKKGDVLKELKVNPEAVALEAQMKSMSKELSDRIGAGTSTETTFESRIQRGNIVEKPVTSVPITDAMKGFDPILGEYEKEEGDEEPQTINLNDSEPKTKDLHDQLIQLNSSIRQLVEHSASGVGLAESQIKATRSLSSNRFA